MAQVPGLPLLLPDYARPDLGFSQDVLVKGGAVTANAPFALLTGDGRAVDVPLAVTFALATAIGGANRTIELHLVNQDGVVLWQVPAPVTQPANTTYTYTWSPLLSQPVAPAGGTSFATPFPPSMLLPGYQLLASVAGFAGVDTVSTIAVSVQHYPTGPRPETTRVPVIATPQLV